MSIKWDEEFKSEDEAKNSDNEGEGIIEEGYLVYGVPNEKKKKKKPSLP